MFGTNIEYQRNTCDCTCNILPSSTPTYGSTKPLSYHLALPDDSHRNQDRSRNKNQKRQKLSLAGYQRSRNVSKNIRQQSRNQSIREIHAPYKSMKHVQFQNKIVQQPSRVNNIEHEYYTTVSSYQPQVVVRNNFHRVQYEQNLRREYSRSTNVFIQSSKVQYTPSPSPSPQPHIPTPPIRNSQYLFPSSYHIPPPMAFEVEKSRYLQPNVAYLPVPSNRPPDLSTQASNHMMAQKSEQPSVIEQNPIRDKEFSISLDSDIKDQKPKPLIFRAIQSINDMTELSQDDVSQVISHGFNRDSHQHMSWGGKQGTENLLEKIRRQLKHPKTTSLRDNVYSAHHF